MTIKISLESIEQAAGQNMSKKNMAGLFGMTEQGFNKKLKREPKLQKAIDAGRATGEFVGSGALLKAVKAGNVTAIRFFLKNIAPEDWSEHKGDNKPDTESRVLVIDKSRGGDQQ